MSKIEKIILFLFILHLFIGYRRSHSQTIDPKMYRALYSTEIFNTDSTALLLSYTRTDYMGKEKHVDIYVRSVRLQNGIYRCLTVTNEVLLISQSNVYEVKIREVKLILVKDK